MSPYLTSGLALVHSRFSTNTFPTWSLAQPFRLLAHNGEINTIRGNRGWMQARESVLNSEALGDISHITPIVQPQMSDSASLDNVLEFLVMSGLSLPHAMSVLVPESFNDKNPISEDLKAYYEYHSILMEPWDGPAALLFSDGSLCALASTKSRSTSRSKRCPINSSVIYESLYMRGDCPCSVRYWNKIILLETPKCLGMMGQI